MAGLGFSVTGNPAANWSSCWRQELNSLPPRFSERQPSGEEEELAAISQCLLHPMKVAVRAAKQDDSYRAVTFGPGAVQNAYSR